MNTKIKRGQIVTYKGAGKVSRLEGMLGKMITGVVIAVTGNDITVRPNHRVPKTAPMHGMDAVLSRSQILAMTDKPVAKAKRAIGDKIEFHLGLDGDVWESGTLLSARMRDDEGNWGFKVKAKGYRSLFVYTRGIRAPK